MLQYSDYEKILRKGKRVDWYDTQVPVDLITPAVKAMASQIVEQINIYEGVDDNSKKNYISTLWLNIRNLPYTMNGDFYLIKKREIEEKIKKDTKTKPKKEEVRTNEVKKVTKNSSLIFGNKTKKTKVI
jgi:hypothetical protein